MKAKSFWINADREGFAGACVKKFGLTFNHSAAFLVRSAHIPVTPPTQPILQVTTEDHRMRGNAAREKHKGTRLSQKAMRTGGNLIA